MKTKVYTKILIQSEDSSWKDYYNLRKWCTAKFGPSKINGQKDYLSPWRANPRHAEYSLYHMGFICKSAFYFRDPAHATMFSLVWADKIR